MSVCQNCKQYFQTIKRQHQRCQAALQKQRVMRKHDINILQEKLKASIKRQQHFKVLNQTLMIALEKDDGINQRSSIFSKSQSKSRGKSSNMLLCFDKQNVTPNRKNNSDRIQRLQDDLLQSRQKQKALQQQNKSLKQEIFSLNKKLSRVNDKKGLSQQSSIVLDSDIAHSDFFEIPKRNQQAKKKRSANLIQCSVCQGRFRPVQFMNHLQQCQ